MVKVTRRSVIAGASLALARPAAGALPRGFDTIVVGAGVFGAWTATRLQAAGQRVALVDAWGPAHARAASGGETRMTRAAYGADRIYSQMAASSLADWQALSARASQPLFHQAGVLFFFPKADAYVEGTVAVHRALGLPTVVLTGAEMARRWPQVDFTGSDIGLFEPQFGALMARRSVQALVAEFTARGGVLLREAVLPPAGAMTDGIVTRSGTRLTAANYVFACGPWLPKLFPALLGRRIFPTRQEVFFFAPPAGDARFMAPALPGWADFNGGDITYGFPDIENRGFKLAFDRHGPPIDPDVGDRIASAAGIAEARRYLARRFPALAGAQLVETRVCQYENSGNGDFLVDRHPDARHVVLVGAGSGHGFKHGPAVGTLATRLVLDATATAEPRFTLASKATVEARAVH